MKKLFTFLSFIVVLYFSLFVSEALAQTPPPSAAAPLDGFTGLLIAAGAAASYRALRNNDSED